MAFAPHHHWVCPAVQQISPRNVERKMLDAKHFCPCMHSVRRVKPVFMSMQHLTTFLTLSLWIIGVDWRILLRFLCALGRYCDQAWAVLTVWHLLETTSYRYTVYSSQHGLHLSVCVVFVDQEWSLWNGTGLANNYGLGRTLSAPFIVFFELPWFCLQCFDAVGSASGRTFGL